MESLEEEDDERFKKQFASYLADDIGSEDIEDMYKEAYEKIREDPEAQATESDSSKWKEESKKYRSPKLTQEQRKEKVAEKIAEFKVKTSVVVSLESSNFFIHDAVQSLILDSIYYVA